MDIPAERPKRLLTPVNNWMARAYRPGPRIRAVAIGRGMLVAFERMETVTNANFGPLIAYLVPGATVLAGFSPFSPVLRSWFGRPADAPTIGGFLYLTVASIAVGMTVNAVRWAVIDTVHAYTGLPLPPLDFSRLGKNVDAFGLLIEIHYRHYHSTDRCSWPAASPTPATGSSSAASGLWDGWTSRSSCSKSSSSSRPVTRLAQVLYPQPAVAGE